MADKPKKSFSERIADGKHRKRKAGKPKAPKAPKKPPKMC